ncbi:MAG: hypothetical protein WD845_11405 [Pirellulales bacterium]
MSWNRLTTAALVSVMVVLAQGQVPTGTAPGGASSQSTTGQKLSGGTATGWRTPGINATRPVTQAAAQSPISNGAPLGSAPIGRVPLGSMPLAQQPAPQQQPVTPVSANEPVQPPLVPVSAGSARGPIARVTPGNGTLPNDAGQQWRDYDISPYTARVTSTNQPEQAIRDWILRETGYEAWHGDVIAVLCANRRTLSVYHTPEMHAVVQEMVDRFVNTEAESHAFGMRVITLDSPNWRTKSHAMLRPVAAQTPGVMAWLMAKEDAALLLNDLARRSDFQEHSTPHLVVNNGQSTVVAKTRARNYVRDVLLRPGEAWPAFEPQMGQIDEGFKFEFHPLLSLDGGIIDAVLKCEVDQVEKMLPVRIDVPSQVVRQQTTKVEVPQIISSRMHERFRWPADQVLLISLGVGPTPVPQTTGGLSVPLFSGNGRADLLVFVESRGKLSAPPTSAPVSPTAASAYPGRY